jgi:hypothetical protein
LYVPFVKTWPPEHTPVDVSAVDTALTTGICAVGFEFTIDHHI